MSIEQEIEMVLRELETKEAVDSKHIETGWLNSYCNTIGDDGLLDSERERAMDILADEPYED